jgi:Ca2+-binding RTX toxin-like protein
LQVLSTGGGTDKDVLFGNSGADLLVGGEGADTLYGDADSDVLFGGVGQNEGTLSALLLLLTEWTSSHTFGNLGQLMDDGSQDSLFGGASLDEFHVFANDLIGDFGGSETRVDYP